jgi:hypothetical protein
MLNLMTPELVKFEEQRRRRDILHAMHGTIRSPVRRPAEAEADHTDKGRMTSMQHAALRDSR